jgi:hypothetical protein
MAGNPHGAAEDEPARVRLARPSGIRHGSRCVFRSIVTARFGIVTAEFGSVTDHFGDVTDGHLVPA